MPRPSTYISRYNAPISGQEALFAAPHRFSFNGQERTDEIAGTGNHTTALYWEYDTRLGRRWNVDPVVKENESPYLTLSGNPIWYLDFLGDDPSTHTDEDGNVIAVYDDGDNGVYKHSNGTSKEDLDRSHGSLTLQNPTSAGGTKIGETEYWDEFQNPETMTPEGTILFGKRESWDPLIKWANDHANDQDLSITMKESKHNQVLDIKTGKWAEYGVMTGRLMNGKYATARSAGNYLAGMNGVTGTFQGYHISGETYMKIAGAYQVGEMSAFNVMRIITLGTAFGPPPYYGEEPYSGRRIIEGINAGLKLMNK